MSDDMIKRLVEKRASAWEQAKTHLDTVEAEGRELSGEAQETWDRLNGELSDLDKRIAELTELDKRNKAAEEIRSEYAEHTPAPKADDGKRSDNDILRAMASGEQRDAAGRVAHEFRDLTKGSATGGGNTVPTSFYGQLVEHMIENSAIRQTNVTVLTTDSGEDLQVPKTTTHPTAAIIAEAGAITESDPAFGQVTLGAYKYGFSVQISSELEQDTGVDLAGYLARIGGEALGNGSGAHFVTGTGASQPNGVVTASTLGVTTGTGQTGTADADELIDLFFSVSAPYRRNAYWMMSDAGLKAARKLKDADNQYLWVPGLVQGEGSTLLGRPVVVDTNVADPALSAKSVVFGDFSRYFIRDVRGVRVERSVDFAFTTDLVTWRFLLRTDGDLIDTTGAIKHLVGAGT